ncbi:hypothetical protein ACLOJK_025537 [Asimina triloba]
MVTAATMGNLPNQQPPPASSSIPATKPICSASRRCCNLRSALPIIMAARISTADLHGCAHPHAAITVLLQDLEGKITLRRDPASPSIIRETPSDLLSPSDPATWSHQIPSSPSNSVIFFTIASSSRLGT